MPELLNFNTERYLSVLLEDQGMDPAGANYHHQLEDINILGIGYIAWLPLEWSQGGGFSPSKGDVTMVGSDARRCWSSRNYVGISRDSR